MLPPTMIVKGLGMAASRVYFHLKAEAVEWESKWAGRYIPWANTPVWESVSRLSHPQHSI